MSDDNSCCTWFATVVEFLYPHRLPRDDGPSSAAIPLDPLSSAPSISREHSPSVLPYELLDIIFDYVRQYDRTKETLFVASLVCRAWRGITFRHRFHCLTIRLFNGMIGYTVTSDFVTILAFLRTRSDVCTAVRRLKLSWRTRAREGVISPRLFEVISALPRLNTLELKSAPASVKLPSFYRGLISESQVTELVMDKFQAGLAGFAFRTFTGTKELELGFVGAEDVSSIAEFFRSNAGRIEHLVYGLDITFPSNEGFLDLSVLRNLKTLSITIAATSLRAHSEQAAVTRAAHSIASLDTLEPLQSVSFRIAAVSHRAFDLEEHLASSPGCVAPVVEAMTSLYQARRVEKVHVGLYDLLPTGRLLDPEGYVPSSDLFQGLFRTLWEAGALEMLY